MQTVSENKFKLRSIFSGRKFHLHIEAVNINDDAERFAVSSVFGSFKELWLGLMSFLNDFRLWLFEMEE